MQSVDFRPRIDRDDWLAEFLRETDLSQRAALTGQRDYRVGTRDDHRIARLADTGGNHKFDMPVRRAPIIPREDSNCMPTLLARPGRRRFHHTRAPAVEQDSAASRNLPAYFKRQLANRPRSITRADDRYNHPPLHRNPPVQLKAERGGEFSEILDNDIGRWNTLG